MQVFFHDNNTLKLLSWSLSESVTAPVYFYLPADTSSSFVVPQESIWELWRPDGTKGIFNCFLIHTILDFQSCISKSDDDSGWWAEIGSCMRNFSKHRGLGGSCWNFRFSFRRNCIKRSALDLAKPVIIGFYTDIMSGTPIRHFLIAYPAFLNPFNRKAEFLGISCYG